MKMIVYDVGRYKTFNISLDMAGCRYESIL